jgi:ribosomal protein S27AE
MESKKAQRGWVPDSGLMRINEQPEVRFCPNCGAKMNLKHLSPETDSGGTGRVTNNVRKYICPVCGRGEIIAIVTDQIGVSESVHAKVTKENREEQGQ